MRWNRATSDKPYKCPHEGCDKSFTAKSSLQNHIRTHSADAPNGPLLADHHHPLRQHIQHQQQQQQVPAAVKEREKPSMRFHCIHPNCKKSFKEEAELRAHLIAYNPGMAAENQFLRDSVLNLLNYVGAVSKEQPALHEQASRAMDMEAVRHGVSSLSALTYGIPVPSAAAPMPSVLGKRSSSSSSSSAAAANGSSSDNSSGSKSKLLEYVESVTHAQSAVGAAWLIHQQTAADDMAPYDDDGGGGGGGGEHEEGGGVPLHVACGYLDDMFSFPEPLGSEAHANKQQHHQQQALQHQLGDESAAAGMWPFNEQMLAAVMSSPLPLPPSAPAPVPVRSSFGNMMQFPMHHLPAPYGMQGMHPQLPQAQAQGAFFDSRLLWPAASSSGSGGGGYMGDTSCNLLALSSTDFPMNMPMPQQQQQQTSAQAQQPQVQGIIGHQQQQQQQHA